MKRPLHRRAIALLWAFAFVFGTVGEGFGLHPCPSHDGGEIGAHGSAAASVHAAHQEAPAASDCHDAAHGGLADADSDDPEDSHSCTCESVCQMGAGSALPAGPQASPDRPLLLDYVAAAPTTASKSLSRPPHFLPFAQAPPRLG